MKLIYVLYTIRKGYDSYITLMDQYIIQEKKTRDLLNPFLGIISHGCGPIWIYQSFIYNL